MHTMNTTNSLEILRRLGEFDTCTVANAIESFGVRLRNEGFSEPSPSGFGRPSPR